MLKAKANDYAAKIMVYKEKLINKISPMDLLNMDSEELAMIKKTFELYDETADLIVAQSEALDEINAKLDKLISLQ